MMEKFNLLLHLQDGPKSIHEQVNCLCDITTLKKHNEDDGRAKMVMIAKEIEGLQVEVTRFRNELALLVKDSHEKSKAQYG